MLAPTAGTIVKDPSARRLVNSILPNFTVSLKSVILNKNLTFRYPEPLLGLAEHVRKKLPRHGANENLVLAVEIADLYYNYLDCFSDLKKEQGIPCMIYSDSSANEHPGGGYFKKWRLDEALAGRDNSLEDEVEEPSGDKEKVLGSLDEMFNDISG